MRRTIITILRYYKWMHGPAWNVISYDYVIRENVMVTKRRSVNTDGSFVVFDHLFLPVQRTGSFTSVYLYLLINEVRFLPKFSSVLDPLFI
jgi:hypothetical protein